MFVAIMKEGYKFILNTWASRFICDHKDGSAREGKFIGLGFVFWATNGSIQMKNETVYTNNQKAGKHELERSWDWDWGLRHSLGGREGWSWECENDSNLGKTKGNPTWISGFFFLIPSQGHFRNIINGISFLSILRLFIAFLLILLDIWTIC